MIDVRRLSVRAVGAITRRFGFPGAVRITEILHSPGPGRGVEAIVETGGGIRIRIDTSNYIERRLFFEGAYEPEVIRELKANLPLDGVAIDVGANIGLHTLVMASVAREGRVLAFEPHPLNRSKLRENLSLNSCRNVKVFDIALDKDSGSVSLHSPDDVSNLGRSSMLPLGEWKSFDVTSKTLDEIAGTEGLERVDLVKIDVEGLEGAVLQGGSEVLKRFRPALVFEFGQDLWSRAGYELGGVIDSLKNAGYESFSIIHRSGLIPVTPELDHANLLVRS